MGVRAIPCTSSILVSHMLHDTYSDVNTNTRVVMTFVFFSPFFLQFHGSGVFQLTRAFLHHHVPNTALHRWMIICLFLEVSAIVVGQLTSAFFKHKFSPRHAGVSDVSIFNDMYQFDFISSKWAPIPIIGTWPPARSQASLTALGNRLFLFGGFNGISSLQDLFSFDVSKGLKKVLSHELFQSLSFFAIARTCEQRRALLIGISLVTCDL
jgi:hypothetical protein